MAKTKVSLVITGTIMVDEGDEQAQVDSFVDDVAALGMQIEEVEEY